MLCSCVALLSRFAPVLWGGGRRSGALIPPGLVLVRIFFLVGEPKQATCLHPEVKQLVAALCPRTRRLRQLSNANNNKATCYNYSTITPRHAAAADTTAWQPADRRRQRRVRGSLQRLPPATPSAELQTGGGSVGEERQREGMQLHEKQLNGTAKPQTSMHATSLRVLRQTVSEPSALLWASPNHVPWGGSPAADWRRDSARRGEQARPLTTTLDNLKNKECPT